MNEPDIAKQLEALLPTSLDDILRANRDAGTLAMASAEQLAPLHHRISGRMPIRGQISDWRFIALTIDMPARNFWREMVYLVGNFDHRTWITSAVKTIDRRRRLVRTKNSHYRLIGEAGVGEPPLEMMMTISAAFNGWGFGPMFGVPPVFA